MGKELAQIAAYLDTEVVIWLVSGHHELLPPKAVDMINLQALLISPMVVLELQYLEEIGRLRSGAQEIIEKLRREIDLKVCELPFGGVATVALQESWTRDPFDRMIVAQAKANGVSPLITVDEKLRAHYVNAVWQ